MTSTVDQQKRIHTLLLDASPILLNTPSLSTLRATSEVLITTAAVVGEIRGEEARSRFESLYRPFIEIRAAKVESVKHVRDFARRTGDLAVLSATDIEVIALAYDLECERNGGDWRLRNVPGQKRLNGKKPEKKDASQEAMGGEEQTEQAKTDAEHDELAVEKSVGGVAEEVEKMSLEMRSGQELSGAQSMATSTATSKLPQDEGALPEVEEQADGQQETTETDEIEQEESEDSDGGWITATNIKRKQAEDEASTNTSKDDKQILQVATMTGDFAMQNVLLQMNLNLLSTKTCKRIAYIKQTILRCHACFATTRDMSKQFCNRCGKPTLTRVSCTTNDRGEVKLHLKQNFQWNNRGNVYSAPKPTSGSANQKWKGPNSGGGQGGWGTGLILAEDQKEYIRVMSNNKRSKQKDLMDEDVLPGILTGERSQNREKVKVGAGRNINSRAR